MTKQLMTLERGLAGWHGSYSAEVQPWGRSYSSFSGGWKCAAHLAELMDGGLLIDKADVLERNPFLAFKSPMLGQDLEPQGRQEFAALNPEKSLVVQAWAAGGDAMQRGMAAMAVHSPEAFDYVGLDVFGAWWREHGARVGQKMGDTILWADGTRQTLAEVAASFDTVLP